MERLNNAIDLNIIESAKEELRPSPFAVGTQRMLC